MQIPMLTGVVGSQAAEFGVSHPLNLEPVIVSTNISKGQFRAPAGAVQIGTGPGVDRGGIVWNGQCFRVMDTKLVRVDSDGTVTVLGDVGAGGPVWMDYSFDRLAIGSGTSLFYWDGSNLTQVTDQDLGPVTDGLWIDGYFMVTDGTNVIVTELADPYSVLPLKYGSAEEDPDMVTGLMKVREEAYVLGFNTIQVFRNVGGNGFPFANVRGAGMPIGCVAPRAKCRFADSFAFVGSGRNEALGVHVAGQGTAAKISTRAIDDALAAVADPTSIELEARSYRDELRLFVHLPERSWVFLANASQKAGEPVWHQAQSGAGKPYRIRHAVHAYGKIIVGDLEGGMVGVLDESTSRHFGDKPEWAFDAGLVYNSAKGGLVHSVELVGLPGRGEEASLFMSMTRDGETFSVERALSTGKPGERLKRLQWRPHARFSNYLGFRFRGVGGMPGLAAIEADIRPLAA